MMLKRRGRVGDSAVIGAGTYADDGAGAVSCTGHGEAFIKAAAAKQAVEALRAGRSPTEAAREVLPAVRRHGGSGGLICVDAAGRVGFAFDTPRMAHAWIETDGREGAVFAAGDARGEAAFQRGKLGLWSGIGLVVGNVVGVGVLTNTGYMAVQLGPRAILLAWLVGGVMAICRRGLLRRAGAGDPPLGRRVPVSLRSAASVLRDAGGVDLVAGGIRGAGRAGGGDGGTVLRDARPRRAAAADRRRADPSGDRLAGLSSSAGRAGPRTRWRSSRGCSSPDSSSRGSPWDLTPRRPGARPRRQPGSR